MLVVWAVAPAVKPVENETAFKKLKDGLLSATSGSVEESKDASGFSFEESESTVSITVVGASGDLAKKKIFPALFALYYEGCLPKVCEFFSFSCLLLIWRFRSIGEKLMCDLCCSTLLFVVMLGVR